MLINLRNALMAGKRLPYDAEVEYLESTGTQYINTGIYANNDTAVDVVCKYTQAFNDNAAVSMDAGNNATRAFTIEQYNNRIYFSFSNSTTQNASLQSSWNQISASQSGLIVNGTSVGVSQVPAFQCEYPLFMFCYGRKGAPIIYGKWQIASCKIYQNGVLVRDYIPVRVGSVGYLYDRVSGALFGNMGTGDFVVGPDILPVEYIESTGTQYIDTGVLATLAYGCKIDLEDVATASYNCFIRNLSNNDFCIGSNNSNPLSSYLRIRGALTWANGIGATKSFEVKNGVIKANGSQIGTYDASMPLGANANNISLFAATNGGTPAKCKVFSCGIYDSNSALVRDLIPVRVGTGSTWAGAMLDRVNWRVYRNVGTGDFLYGVDIGKKLLELPA